MKWYEEFPDVGFVEKLLAELDWSDFLFIHIGEELDEIDTRGSFRDPPFRPWHQQKHNHTRPHD